MPFLRKRSRSQCSINSSDDEILRRQRKDDRTIRRYSGESSNTQIVESDFETSASCVLRNFPKHKSAHLQFLSWVAYTRKYTNLPITQEERRTCPLLWCREVFIDQEAMLRHVWNCEHLEKGLYWCFQCQKPERVGRVKCKRCHGGHSKTDRIANVAKKMFSALGSRTVVEHCSGNTPVEKPHSLSKIAEVTEECQSWDDGNSLDTQAQANRDRHLDPPSMPELPNTGIWEMEATYVMSEMEANWDSSPELPDSEVSDVRNERRTSISKPSVSFDFPATSSTERDSPRPLRSLLPRLDTHTILGPVKKTPQYSPGYGSFENPMSATIVSPLSATGVGFDFGTLGSINISPTDSERSGQSLFTDSGYSSATIESSWNGSMIDFNTLVTGQKGKAVSLMDSFECGRDYDTLDFTSIPSKFPAGADSQELTVFGAMTAQTTDGCAQAGETTVLSPHWTDAKSLVISFSEVLNEHLQHSQHALREMASNAMTKELLSLSSSSIVSIGFGVLENLLQGRFPHAVLPLFAFTHIAYALAIAIDHDQSKVHTTAWFQDLFSMLDNISSDRQRQAYAQIVRVIWQPRDAAELPGSFSTNSSSAQTENRLIRACKHFLDLQESFVYRERMSAIQKSIPQFNFVHASFALQAKARIIDELIKNNSTVAFIENVVTTEKRLDQGLIIELRQLELELICAAKLGSQSDALYTHFLAHVASLCDQFYDKDASIKSRTSHHLDTIYSTQHMLSAHNDSDDEEFQEEVRFDTSEDKEAEFDFDFGIADSGYNTMDLSMQAEVDAYSGGDAFGGFSFDSSPFDPSTPFEASSSSLPLPAHPSFNSSSASLPAYHSAPYQQFRDDPLGSAQTRSSSSKPSVDEASKHRCHCGYEPTGEEKWKASNLARHKRIQHATRKYRCVFRGCKSEFTRSDNLKSHQRDKGHELKKPVPSGRHEHEGGGEEISVTARKRPSKKQKTGKEENAERQDSDRHTV